jgi:hypothetical protein
LHTLRDRASARWIVVWSYAPSLAQRERVLHKIFRRNSDLKERLPLPKVMRFHESIERKVGCPP